MIDLKDFEYDELIEYLKSIGEKKFRAEQIFSWLHKGVESYDEMTNCGIHEWVLCHVLHFQLLLPTSRCYQAEFGPIGVFQCTVACNFLIFCGGFFHLYL